MPRLNHLLSFTWMHSCHFGLQNDLFLRIFTRHSDDQGKFQSFRDHTCSRMHNTMHTVLRINRILSFTCIQFTCMQSYEFGLQSLNRVCLCWSEKVTITQRSYMFPKHTITRNISLHAVLRLKHLLSFIWI